MVKKALLLGGTGAIGIYLAPELSKRGFKVDITSRSPHESSDRNITYLQSNAREDKFLQKALTEKKYDLIVDFMSYSTEEFKNRHNLLLQNCKQYIFLSSYRVFADDNIITEKSPRLLDVLTDKEYLATDEYALAKARQEDILRKSKKKNWTIVRPSITYSQRRFQFATVEADVVIWRALHDLPMIMPRVISDKKTTLTWAGDTGRLIAKLALNKDAMSEDFNIGTSENYTWSEIAQIYHEIIGLKVKSVDLEEYIRATGYANVRYLIKYNRMYDRIFDNSKLLKVTGETQGDFVKLRDGLRRELLRFRKDPKFNAIDYAKHARIDKLTHVIPKLKLIPRHQWKVYLGSRFPRLLLVVVFAKKIKSKLRIRTRVRAFFHELKILPQKLWSMYISHKNITKIKQINNHPDGAILTLIDYSNYGNILQRFALQKFLHNNGYNFVSYEHPLPKSSNLSDKKCVRIASFVNHYIARKKFTGKDEFPAYIVGSDQVWRNWRYKNEFEELGTFFFNFVKSADKKLIVYAASFGKEQVADTGLSREFIEKIKPYVHKISKISLRERSGLKIAKKLWGVKSEIVLDPTLLLTPEEYKTIIEESSQTISNTAGVFAYVLGPNERIAKFIANLVNQLQTDYFQISPYSFNETLPSVQFWLKSVSDAKLVVTDSFHCVVFAILFNTPFVAIRHEHGGVARVKDLLRELGISMDRFVSANELGEIDINKLSPINWGDVNNIIEEKKKLSAEWLMSALES